MISRTNPMYRVGKSVLAFALVTLLTVTQLPVPAFAAEMQSQGGGVTIKQVEWGESHHAVVTSDGALWVWGDNKYGQVGDGTTEDKVKPVKVLEGVESVKTYFGQTVALKADGSLWMWGNNAYSDGTCAEQHRPVKTLDNVSDFEIGQNASWAIKTDKSLWVWSGTPGTGSLLDSKTTTVPVKIFDDVVAAAVPGGGDICLAKRSDDSLWVLGKPRYGYFSGVASPSGDPVQILENVREFGFGRNDAAYAILHDGSLWVWGKNDYGQLGVGNTSTQWHPVKILDNVIKASVGNSYTSSAAITEDGGLWVWGSNTSSYKTLGIDTDDPQYTPVRMLEGAKDVFQSWESAGALMQNGSLLYWGGSSPSPVTRLTNVALYKYRNHSGVFPGAAVADDGSLWTWGSNAYAHLGNGGLDRFSGKSYDPARALDTVTDYWFGNGMAALTSDGCLWVWGTDARTECDGRTDLYRPTKTFENGQWLYGCEDVTIGPRDSSVDDYIVEQVRKYTSEDDFKQYANIMFAGLSYEEWLRRLNNLFKHYGITDVDEGVKYMSSTDGYRSAYKFLTTNESFCAYNFLYWLYETNLGQATRAALYADGLIFNYEASAYANPFMYINEEEPGVKKSKAVLKRYMEIDSDDSVTETLGYSKGLAKACKNLMSINKEVIKEDAQSGEVQSQMIQIIDQISKSSSKSEAEHLSGQFVSLFHDEMVKTGTADAYIRVDKLSTAFGYSSKVLKFAGATTDDIVAMINLNEDIRVYENHRRFLESIRDDNAMSGEMRKAADSILRDIDNGYYNRIKSIMGNAIELGNGLIQTDKKLWQVALEKAGVSAGFTELLSGALGTLSMGTFVSNIVVDTSDVVNQTAYTQKYAELGVKYALQLEEDKRAFLANESAENAWRFFEDYTTLWTLRYMGEEQYLDSNKIKMFIFASVPGFQYEWKEAIVQDNLDHLQKCRFDLSAGIEIPESVQYKQKAVFRCPVDVDVFAPDGTLIATLEDGVESDVSNEYGRFVVLQDSYSGDYVKVVCLNFAEDFTMKARAIDSGLVSMEYASAGESEGEASFDNVNVAEGSVIVVDTAALMQDGVISVDADGDGAIDAVQAVSPKSASAADVESMELSDASLELWVGDSKVLDVAISPADAMTKAVAWVSLDPDVATVVDGKVEAIAVGETTIRCFALGNTDAIDECVVTVAAVQEEPRLTAVEEVPATCEEDGVAAHWSSDEGDGLFSDSAGENAVTLGDLVLPALGHDWDEGAVSVEPTCDDDGIMTFTCRNDSSHTKTEPIVALGHDWGEWAVKVEPTYDAPGVRERICLRCGEIEQEAVAQLERIGGGENDGGAELSAVTVTDDATGVAATSKVFAGDDAAILVVTDLSAANAARASEMEESYGTAGAAVFRAYDVKVERIDDAGNHVAVDSGLDDLILTFPVDVAYDGRAAKVVHLHDDGGNVVARTYALEVADGKLVVAVGQLSEFAISVAGGDDGGASDESSDGIGDGGNGDAPEGSSGEGSQQGAEPDRGAEPEQGTEAGAGKATDEADAEVPGSAQASGENVEAGTVQGASPSEREPAGSAGGPGTVRRSSGEDGAVPPTGDPAAAAILVASSVALIASLVALRSRRNARRGQWPS